MSALHLLENIQPHECICGFEYNPSIPVKLPAEAISYKLRVRADEFPKIFVRYSDRVEQCTVALRDGFYQPAWIIGVNRKGGA